KELKRIVKESMNAAGVPFEQFADRGTFMLSGGEKRKVAVAGILAMNSDVVLFDEPTAGLDPKSRKNLVEQLKKLTETGKTVIFSTHRMDEAAFADRQIDMQNGKIIHDSEKDLSTSVEVTTKISNDTTAISSDTTVISSDTTVISSDTSVISSDTSVILSDTSVISSGTSVISSGVEKSLPPAPAVQGTSLLKILRKTELFSEDPLSHKKNLLQKVGSTGKYCIFLSIFILSLLFNNVWVSAAMLGVSLIYGIIARYPAKKYFSSFMIILPWMIFFCAFQLVISIPEENDVIYAQWGWFTITQTKIIACINLVLHTFAAFCSARVFLYSTAEREFLEGISGLLKPFTKMKLPTKSIIVIVEIIFRFIPLLIEEACSIVKTQIVRGGLGTAKSLWAKVRILIPLFIPLIIQTVKRSEALADALTARKF
ncbi:MAG: AAA family ATPase, partial [Treponema sp.]|nr:AAA family ATPase [Candidatus Treponema equifaecale]